MQYVMLSDRFGGLNTYLNPDKVGPGGAQEVVGVDVSTGALEGLFVSQAEPTPSFLAKTILTFKGANKSYNKRYTYSEFGGYLYRSPKGYSTTTLDGGLSGIQYSSDGDTWNSLSMYTPIFVTMPSPRALVWRGAWNSATAYVVNDVVEYLGSSYLSIQNGTNRQPNTQTAYWTLTSLIGADNITGSPAGRMSVGTYEYVITYKNALGHESGPSFPLEAVLTGTDNAVYLDVSSNAFWTATVSNTNNNVFTIGAQAAALLRVGMRVNAGPGLPKVIQSISGTTVTLETNTGASPGASIVVSDAQIVWTVIYRRQIGVTTEFLFVGETTGSIYLDVQSNAELGRALTTSGCAQIPAGSRNLAINPFGTLFANVNDSVFYFSLVVGVAGAGAGLYRPTQSFSTSGTIMASIYALDRFMFFTINRNFSVFLDDAISGIPVLKFIENSEPCQLSNYVYPIEYGGQVLWNTSNGILSTDGNSITSITKLVFKKQENELFKDCFGSISFNDVAYFLLPDISADTGGNNRALYKLTKENGWAKVFIIKNLSGSTEGSLGFWQAVVSGTPGNAMCSYAAQSSGGAINLVSVESSNTRQSAGDYWTGEWVGEKHSALKKFRKISALFRGSIEIEIYIDGNALPNKLSGNNGSATKRVSWWLPPAIKGRAISLKITRTTSAYSVVEELGVWVGEQRREMP
jgi:hypothetical protein